MFTDYKVQARYASDICRTAADARALEASKRLDFPLDVYIQKLTATQLPNKPRVILEIVEHIANDTPAYVHHLLDKTVLYFKKNVWADLKSNHRGARHIAAHEIGHVFMHDNTALAFSGTPQEFIKIHGIECSAEHQADSFAAAFLVPSEAFFIYNNEFDIMSAYQIDDILFKKRLEIFRNTNKLFYNEWTQQSVSLML